MKISVLCIAAGASAFPWVVDQPGVDSSLFRANRQLRSRQQPADGAGSAANCPFNANHVPAAPVTAQYPYNNAKNGLPGNGVGGYLVPAVGDTAHEYQAPGPNDIRGPCPGLNTAANHNFLPRDGIATFAELVDAQQNLYNVGYDLANLLAVLGLTLTDGDPVTEKLSIGCDATTRTSFNPALTGSEPGLDGHNKFEGDTSLTRNDYFLDDGDNFTFNQTLFAMMDATCQSSFTRDNLALYRYQRYQQSLAGNPNFYFGPLSLLLFGAASFLYELMPSGTHNYAPDLPTISSFFYEEKIPDNWTNRVSPYSIPDVGNEIFSMYGEHPVAFGGVAGNGTFLPLNWAAIQNGQLPTNFSPAQTSCLLYQFTTGQIPSSLNGVITPSVTALSFAASKLNPIFQNLGCPIALT